ncbi:MAG: hypothetical protein CMH63_01840 [Nanoarchaeota archaeon]|jgi:hypothetical protein|nr:hypothetical protein [Nanoarchaeota archaeon]|tara:strand:- start:38028 stop:38243 length:216 start_codon:yes stop_codon:yes gene_type:complete
MLTLEVKCDEENIKLLKFETRREFDIFNERRIGVLYSRRWCEQNGINYVNPDVFKVSIKIYEGMRRSGELI